MEYAGYKKYGPFIDKEVLHADQLNALWDGIRQNGSELDKINTELILIDREEIDASKDILGFKGKLTVDEFLNLPAANQGHIYQIDDNESNINFYNQKWNLSLKNGDFVICTKTFDTDDRINIGNIDTYWKVNHQSAFSDASSFESGMVNTGNQSFSGNKVFNDNVTILGNLQLSKNEIYIGGSPIIIPDNNLVLKTVALLDKAIQRIESLEREDDSLLEEIQQLRDSVSTVYNSLAAFRTKTSEKFTELTEKYNAEIANIYKMLAAFDERLKNLYVKTEVDRAQLTVAYKEADEKLKQELLDNFDNVDNSIQLAVEQVQREFNLADDVVRTEYKESDEVIKREFRTADSVIKEELHKTEENIREDMLTADQSIIDSFTKADSILNKKIDKGLDDLRIASEAADRQLKVDMNAADQAIISSFTNADENLKSDFERVNAQTRNDLAKEDAVIQLRVTDLTNQVNNLDAGLQQRVDDAVTLAFNNFNPNNNIEMEILRGEFAAADNVVRSEFSLADEAVREEFLKGDQNLTKEIQKTLGEAQHFATVADGELRKAFRTEIDVFKNEVDQVDNQLSSKINTLEKSTSTINSEVTAVKNAIIAVDNKLVEVESTVDTVEKKIPILTKMITTADTELKNQANAADQKIADLEKITTDQESRIKNLEDNGPVNPNPDTPTLPGGNASIERLGTIEEYEAIKAAGTLDQNKFYFIVDEVKKEPLYLYIGEILIAQKGEMAPQGFPYIFPIIF